MIILYSKDPTTLYVEPMAEEEAESGVELSMIPKGRLWSQFEYWPEDPKQRKLNILIYSLAGVLIILICTGICCYCADYCCFCCPKAKEST